MADGRVLKSSLKKKVKRASGLGDLLWKGDAVDTVKSQQLNQEPITSVSSDTEKFKNKKSSNKSDDAPQFDLF
ncbi:MAG: transcription initiation factor IIF auxiliary subunit [Bermanella sp.]